MNLLAEYLLELFIQRKRKALKACTERIKQAVRDENLAIARGDADGLKEAIGTQEREGKRYEKLDAELLELESPDDVVRRTVQVDF